MILSGAMQLSCIIEHDDCGALLETHLMSSMKFQYLKFTEKKFLKTWDNLATKDKVMESEEEEQQQNGVLPYDSDDLLVLLPSDDEDQDASRTPTQRLTIGDGLQALPKIKNGWRKNIPCQIFICMPLIFFSYHSQHQPVFGSAIQETASQQQGGVQGGLVCQEKLC